MREYYALLPGNTDAGWARLTDRYRATTSGNRATYDRFWTSVKTVEVLQATGSAPGSVVATLRYAFTDGRRYEERTSYSLVDDGGVLKIDRSSVLSSRPDGVDRPRPGTLGSERGAGRRGPLVQWA